jgi:hypothetical protein
LPAALALRGLRLAPRQKKGLISTNPARRTWRVGSKKFIALHAHRRGNLSPRRFFCPRSTGCPIHSAFFAEWAGDDCTISGPDHYCPVPVRAAVAVALGLLAAIVSVPTAAPFVVGANCTSSTQLEPAASDAGQLFTSTKEAAPVPVTAIEVRLSGAAALNGEPFVVFVNVIVCVVLVVPVVTDPKLTAVADSEIDGRFAPVPIRLTACVPEEALSVKNSVAAWLPAADGAKRTSVTQLADAASDAGQFVTALKAFGDDPESETEAITSGALPVLVSVTVCAAL